MALAKEEVQDSPPPPKNQEGALSISPAASVQTPPRAAPADLSPAPPATPVGKPFMVAFDGAVLTGSIAIRSVRDIDRLMKVLQAQKAAFEAMEDNSGDVGEATQTAAATN